MRRNHALVALAALAASSGVARADGLDGQKYVPAAGAAGGFVVERTLIPQHLDWGLGLMLNYADDPVVVSDEATGDDVAKPLHEALTMNLMASIGLWDVAELAIDVPLDLVWSGDTTVVGGDTYQASTGMGDLRLLPKVDFVRTPSFGFGLALPVRLPTGDDLALRGAGDLTIEPKLLLSFGSGALAFGLNAGYLVHSSDEGREGPGGDALTFGGALRWRLPTESEDWVLHGEVYGSYESKPDNRDFHNFPVEALLGLIYEATPNWSVYLGGATGVSDGVGAPDFRLVFGVRYTSVGFVDRDADGIYDDRDKCPTRAEDHDDYEDDDGCPEDDNDNDGIRDEDDECPDAAEDPGAKDRDGCPEHGHAEYRKGRIVVLGKIRFKTDSAELLPSSDPILDDVASEMKKNPRVKLRVEGHSDNVGDAGYNRKLSAERARSVRAALIRRGVSGGRLDAEGYGETRPVTTNRTERGRAKNRRVELRTIP
jgi:outer membrane protein OmpA-like peptidoglycan-associated protein